MSTFSILAEAAAGGNPVTDIAKAFGVNAWGLFCQILSFCLVAVLLHRYAYHPILIVLEERRKRIAEGLAASFAPTAVPESTTELAQAA